MVTLTLPWWGFILYFTGLGFTSSLIGMLMERRRTRRAQRDTLRV